ncbi:hypothetical protein V6C32_15035 [Desulforamulus ruminis]|nr:hypothetical protein [Desulforamulus ruminis]
MTGVVQQARNKLQRVASKVAAKVPEGGARGSSPAGQTRSRSFPAITFRFRWGL